MPNWCDNWLEIVGDEYWVSKFMQENINEDEELSFEMSCPVPDDVDEYGWCIDNWGTKWDAQETQLGDEIEGQRNINFETAWSPPYRWLRSVAEKYDSLQFFLRYAEGGCGFSGVIEYEDGEMQHGEQGDYGDFYGDKCCNICECLVGWDDVEFEFKEEYNICVDCYDETLEKIKNAVRSKKIKKLPQKLACSRISRNPIMDNYLMRKVFIPRLNECVA